MNDKMTELTIQGMTCQNCARHLAEALQQVPGVAAVSVLLAQGRAVIRWQPEAIPSVEALISAVSRAGFKAAMAPGTQARPPAAAQRPWAPAGWSSALAGWRLNVVLGTGATLPLMAGEWFFPGSQAPWFRWTAFVLAAVVQMVCGARFYRGAWRQLARGRATMDTLVALGSTTAFGYSVWGLLAGGHAHLYFMEAAAIITLISAGHWLESLASARAASALEGLMHLAPHTARRLEGQGAEVEVPVADLQVGDRVRLKPGDHVPTDGEVIEGRGAVDEAMLTGESVPVDKGPGARLYAGTANLNGQLIMRVQALGEATALAHIIAVVQRAQTSRANIQRLGDQVSNFFVPAVVVMALATGLMWGFAPEFARGLSHSLARYLWPVGLPETALAAAFIHAAAVLIVACPCAMGLATPAAIMAGTNAAARRGILIRDGVALEKTGRITAVLFDKTGTLTQGKMSVIATEDACHGGAWGADLWQMAVRLAHPSAHPLCQAIVAKLDRPGTHEGPMVTDRSGGTWQEWRGHGVEERQKGSAQCLAPVLLRLGSLSWLQDCGVSFDRANRFAQAWQNQGATVLGLAAGQTLLGVLALQDTLKPRAAAVLHGLRQQGKTVYLITGDHPLTAAAIARQAGIPPENVWAAAGPARKAALVRQLQQQGERIAFVGDGINDAPALEQADLGIAVSQASDVAREAADIILLKSDIQAIPEALALAHATLRTIKQNLFWAFFYNGAAVPLAALGFLSPVVCAAAMGLSDLVVIGNALRLAYGWENSHSGLAGDKGGAGGRWPVGGD